MILGPKKLLELVKTKKLVEGLSERELINPEGAGFDLRLGEVYRIKGDAFLGETERKTPDIELVAKYQHNRHSGKPRQTRRIQNPSGQKVVAAGDSGHPPATQALRAGARMTGNSILIKQGEFYLVKTMESVNMPQNLTASITPRSTTYRSGLFIRTGNVPPGYCGELIFGVKNEGPITVEIEMGARIVHIQFHEVRGGGSLYRGQWQGGRVTTRRKERQV